MIDPSYFNVMTDSAKLKLSDVVLDIGSGLGFFTTYLAERCEKVIAIEADSRLVAILRKRMKQGENVAILEGNVLKIKVPKFNKVASIPPYYLSSRLLQWLYKKNWDDAVLILQKEFADRLVADVNCPDYGKLTVLTYYYTECELLDDVPRSAFYPQPEVDSRIVHLQSRSERPFRLMNEALFGKLVQSLFTQRNRRVRSAALPFLESVMKETPSEPKAKAEALPFKLKRVRELAPEDLGEIANAIAG